MEGRTLHTLSAMGLVVRQSTANPGNPTTISSIQISPTLKIALIAGGGGLVLVVVALVIFCVCRRRRKKKNLPVATTPTDASFFNPNALPENPLPQRQPSNSGSVSNELYRQPSSQRPMQQPGAAGMYNDYSAGGAGGGGGGYGAAAAYGRTTPAPADPYARGTTPDPYARGTTPGASSTDPLSQRRANDTPAPVKLNTHLRAPSGVGLERVNATAWGVRGRHVDAQGQYHGSVAQQGGMGGNPDKDLPQPPVPAMPARYQQQQPQTQDVYGDDDVYATTRAQQMQMEQQRNRNNPGQPAARYANTPAPPGRAATAGPQSRAAAPPLPANPYRQELGNPYISAARGGNPYQNTAAAAAPAPAGYGAAYADGGRYGNGAGYAHSGAGSDGRYADYAHSRNPSDERYALNSHSRNNSDERYQQSAYAQGGYGRSANDGGYDDYAAGRYGHARQVSDETEAAPNGWL